ncbi:MAG: methylated-DNA--[protein]-cysteine S-methyltransferase [Polyangiales bacterium]
MDPTPRFIRTEIATPIGTLLLVTDGQAHVRAVDWHDYETRMLQLLGLHYRQGFTLVTDPAPAAVVQAFEAYFAGDRQALDRLPVATGGTAFQREVWAALRGIPLGTTVSYGALAERIGKPRAVRAVGLANGANPISVVVPCHRVIGASGALTGYAGGLARKRWLLEHEGALS